MRLAKLVVGVLAALFCLWRPDAGATDFYELQIYTVDTTPEGRWWLELHSSNVSSATGAESKQNLPLYQIHNTLELTYGLLPWLEVGQYLCTARLDRGIYEYAGGRTKVHFGVPFTESWPVAFGVNVEFDYMRRDAVDDPLTLEVMPIAQARIGRWFIVGNFTFGKQFSGPGTHQGLGLEPAGQLSYAVNDWLEPALEYYGDLGPLADLPRLSEQQQFLVPAVNLHLIPRLELNFGFGIGLTSQQRGRFFKGTAGWLF
ncbi:MAG TPA: hypothetical protein VFB33_01120 [Candidatus Binataceae bacterium]|jgi:hypothetical protein|nr:hypothetical protein [Candidatus Binataceae bacterium]